MMQVLGLTDNDLPNTSTNGHPVRRHYKRLSAMPTMTGRS